jgi:hypothetical protein
MKGVVKWYSAERTQGVIEVIEGGIVSRYFLLQSKISRSPVVIESGQVAHFPFSLPPLRPGLLPVAMCVEIEPTDISTGLEALTKPQEANGGAQ